MRNSARLDRFLLGSTNLLFGLEPIVELRAGLIAALDVEFVGPAPDAFLKWQRLDRAGIRITSGDHGSVPVQREMERERFPLV